MPDYHRLLKAYIYASEADNEGEWRAYCPICENPKSSKTPSASINFDMGVWSCFKADVGCPGGGTLRELVDVVGANNVVSINKNNPKAKDDKPDKPLPSEEMLNAWHARLIKQERLLRYMTEERGLSRTTLKEFQIGHDGYRFTIPIRDAEGNLVNIRRYDPRRRDQNKMISYGKGYGKARIYGLDTLQENNEVVLAEGEWDRLIALQMGLPAVTHTAGAMTFLREWAVLFSGKVVYVCYDNDDSGRRGAMKVGRILKDFAAEVRPMSLDTDIKGGDITDFFVKQGRTVEEFKELQSQARPIGRPRNNGHLPKVGETVSLEESYNSSYGNKPLELFVSIAGKQNPPYLVPKRIHARCDQDKGKVCAICPMAAFNGEMIHEIPANDPSLVEFTNTNNKYKELALAKIISARCTDHIEYDVEDQWTVEELYATNSVDHRDESRQIPGNRRILNVGGYSTPVNSTVRVIGSQTTDPATQRALLTSWLVEPTQTNIDRFSLTPELRKRLGIFRTSRGIPTLERCYEIADDLAANVTHIYGRRELHVAYDLVWHSVLDFKFLGQPVGKGWLEMLVVGDTRTGKSECAVGLAKHYNAGIVKSCEGATFAGIVGGVQQMGGKHWTTTWGIIPLNDRRLVVLDEASGLKDKDVIENMSAIRSSGRAQLTKIAQEETSARTRMIWISNPPDGRALREIPGSGMDVVAQLVRNPEDIARFDYAMAAASEDVAYDVINAAQHKRVRHQFTSELCAALVMWAWSRKSDQVVWLDGVEQAVLDAAKEVGAKYVPDPPLVQGANIRVKLARLAVAMAARTFSTDQSGECVLVRRKHVNAAVEFLDTLYGMESFGYLRSSRRTLTARRRAEAHEAEVGDYLRHNDDVRHTLLMVGSSLFKVRDFEEFAGMERLEAQVAVRKLLEWKMIRRLSKGMIRMEPKLIELVRQMEDSEDA